MKLEILRRALCLLMTVCLLTAVPSCGLLDLLPEDSSESEETEGPSPDSLPGIDSDEISEESVPVFSYVSADETSFSSDPERKAAEFIVRSVNRGIEALNEYGNGTRANVLDYDPASYPRAYDGLSEAGKTAYETMRKASAEFSGYEIRESELGGPNPYGVVVDAEYALFADYPEVSMYYSDDYGYDLHQPRYFLPNEYGRECEDIERVQEAVGFYRAVFDRILAWMPEGLENVQKCVYLTAVLCD
ncbi:MAG: hypothetical protein ILO68_01745, partial [Clostridia bacterium]|nr:hypothetical protein [Clostridia bacterium]